jgi:type I restriction enzyme S subunit
MTFELKRLGDVAEIVGGGTPSTKQSNFWDGEIPWLTPKDLSSFKGVYVERGSRSITSDGLRASSAKMLPPGSVLYTSRAPIGYVAIARNSIATNQGFKSFVLKEGFVPEYVFYLLKASKAEIESHASGGTFAEISAKAIADVLLPFPPFEHQRAIANLLSSLDMKLEINRSISKSLESIAHALFKSWFIDFDPVKAQISGEKPVGMDEATAALFPDSFEESELGLIPSGWKVMAVENLLTRLSVKGLAKSINLENLGKTLVLEQGESVVAGFVDQDADVLASPLSPKFVFGDHTCRMKLSTLPFSVFPNTIVLDCKVVSAYWAFMATKGLQSFETYRRHWMEFAYKKVVVPDGRLAQTFGDIVRPIYSQMDNLMLENRILAELRDSLLPRLISGEVKIPEEMLASQ